MPQEDEASTQNLMGDVVGGLESTEPQNSEESWECHQLMSERMEGLGVLQMKGEEE